jgi:ribosomal protein S18 acetylase RimI-like enzyme
MNLDWAQVHGAEYFAKYFDSEENIILLAESEGMGIGYLAGYLKPPSDYRPMTRAELESIYVEPAHRSSGVGKRLTQEFVAWCRSREAQHIGVTAYAENRRAVAFYRSLGFHDKHTTLELTLG